jgi:hypothetical protein
MKFCRSGGVLPYVTAMTYRVRERFFGIRKEPSKPFIFVTITAGSIITMKAQIQPGLVAVLLQPANRGGGLCEISTPTRTRSRKTSQWDVHDGAPVPVPRFNLIAVSALPGRSRSMAYEAHDFGNGRYEIRASSERICQIVRHSDGTWSVDEDNSQRIFPSFDDALDCARELGGDPDLPALTQI